MNMVKMMKLTMNGDDEDDDKDEDGDEDTTKIQRDGETHPWR